MKPKHFGDSFRGRRKFQREFQRTRKPMSEQDLALEIAKQMDGKREKAQRVDQTLVWPKPPKLTVTSFFIKRPDGSYEFIGNKVKS